MQSPSRYNQATFFNVSTQITHRNFQIVEVYSSGGDFHLELPTGELEGPKDMWEIAPLQTKAVIRVRFHARSEQNHTAYVRIKLNNTEEVLVVPLEVQVTPTAGIYEPQGCVDFGVGGSLHDPKKVKLYMQNPLKKSVRIHSVTSTSKAIKIEYENAKIPGDSRGKHGQLNVFPIGTLTLDCKFFTTDFFTLCLIFLHFLRVYCFRNQRFFR